jgi:hypothetical protein
MDIDSSYGMYIYVYKYLYGFPGDRDRGIIGQTSGNHPTDGIAIDDHGTVGEYFTYMVSNT